MGRERHCPDADHRHQYVDNDPAKAVEMTRPLCAFPKAAKYKGSGDANDCRQFHLVPIKPERVVRY